ncbi:MAG TPA: DMT family transporter [Thermoleophilaceae bacterium]|nr:DMT family transporter [Thermoleophilaceae bacterium]
MLAVVLSLGSSLVYGVSDFLGGLKSRSLPLLAVLLVSQGTALAVLALSAPLLGESPPDGEHLAYAAIAGAAEAAAIAALYRGLAIGTMSIVAPVAACAPAFPVAASAVLGELPGALQSAGIALAIAGVAMISLGPPGREASASTGVSVVYGLVTALGFGVFLTAMDAASEGGVHWALLIARLVAVAIFVAVLLVTRQRPALARRDVPVLALIGVLVLAADALYAIASTEGLLSVVAVLSSLYPVVTIALAWLYLRERLRPVQQLGVAVTICGAVAISLA